MKKIKMLCAIKKQKLRCSPTLQKFDIRQTFLRFPHFLLVVICALIFLSCVTGTSAEEYYSIGMAYFEMGKYEDAQRWLSRAAGKNKTLRASEYNLGRIAYETGRYTDASNYFRKILKRDPKNVMALQAEAYTQIKLGDIVEADKYYAQVLEYQPDNADAGYNHALILFAMEKPKDAEELLMRFEIQLEDNKDNLLLLARLQKAQKKLDAIDTYDKWLQKNTDPSINYEYAIALENGGFYAKSLEQMQLSYKGMTADTATLKRSTVHFGIAKLMLIADPTDDKGIDELSAAFTEGYKDSDVISGLIKDPRLPKTRQDEIRRIADTLIKKDTGTQGSGTSTGTDSGTGTGTGSGTDSSTGTGTGSGTDSSTGTGTGTDASTGTGTNSS
ncbi:MAG: hypothetical protein Ta2B_11780 [Termitinemataceae bacterium]|nr:MAG: hypothetical protein Ta2B_11780 [Termitinemataceae bacterium]